MSAKVARAFRSAAKRSGCPPVMFLTAESPEAPAKYNGDEHGMTLTGGGVALHVASGLRGVCGCEHTNEGLPYEVSE